MALYTETRMKEFAERFGTKTTNKKNMEMGELY